MTKESFHLVWDLFIFLERDIYYIHTWWVYIAFYQHAVGFQYFHETEFSLSLGDLE